MKRKEPLSHLQQIHQVFSEIQVRLDNLDSEGKTGFLAQLSVAEEMLSSRKLSAPQKVLACTIATHAIFGGKEKYPEFIDTIVPPNEELWNALKERILTHELFVEEKTSREEQTKIATEFVKRLVSGAQLVSPNISERQRV